MKQATFFSLCSLALLAAQGRAQVVRVDTNSLGYGSDVWFSRTYDSQSVMTFLAKVEDVVEAGPTTKDGAVAISYVVRPYTRQDIGGGRVRDVFQAPITVEVGPSWFVKGQATKVRAGDYVSVTGSRINESGRTFIVAEMVKRNKQVLGLRRPDGEPFWRVYLDAYNPPVRNAAKDALTRTQQEIASGESYGALPGDEGNQHPTRFGNVDMWNVGPPQFHFGNVYIFGNPLYYGPYWTPYYYGIAR